MDEHEDLIQRLRDLGRQPIDPAVRSAHLASMERRPVSLLRSKLRVAAAFLAGLLVGGSGLAVAGALPDPAQNVAHNVFEKVGVQVPQPERYHGEECGPEAKRNHGQYVRADKSLAKSDCGKPLGSGEDADGDEAGESGAKKGAGEAAKRAADPGPCEGPPPWAIDKSLTPEEKAASQAQRVATCGEDDLDDAAETPDASREADEPTQPTEPTTTTTEPTTTSTVTSTTPETTTTAG